MGSDFSGSSYSYSASPSTSLLRKLTNYLFLVCFWLSFKQPLHF